MVNQLLPHIWGGRMLVLFTQSLVYPLKQLNDTFLQFAKEKHIEARMTSQVMYLEWYLNYKLNKHLLNSGDKIFISEGESLGVDIYHLDSADSKPFTVWNSLDEASIVIDTRENPREMFFKAEEKAINKASFVVCVPQISISQKEMVYLVSYIVNTYKLAGKTYLIKIAGEELIPTTT